MELFRGLILPFRRSNCYGNNNLGPLPIYEIRNSNEAAEENEKGAALLGYSPQFLAGANWVLASITAGVAGILFIHKTQPAQIALFVVGGLGAALFGNLLQFLRDARRAIFRNDS